jgi:hypothetical protein
MRYLISVIDDETTSSTPADRADRTAEDGGPDAFNDRLKAAGHWVFAAGLSSPSTATVVDNREGGAIFTDGAFLESKEYLGGLWIIEAPNLDVALELAAEGSKVCHRKVEVRPFEEESA